MVRPRQGRSRLGCLVILLIAAVALHVGFDVGEAYFRYYRYKDAMSQQVRFAATRSDAVIRQQLAFVADSLGLPPRAKQVTIRRTDGEVGIEARYAEEVKLPGRVRVIQFHPRAGRQ